MYILVTDLEVKRIKSKINNNNTNTKHDEDTSSISISISASMEVSSVNAYECKQLMLSVGVGILFGRVQSSVVHVVLF
jgi:hypothetical protein